MLHGSGFAFHDVSFNPVDPRLVVTANQNEGVSLLGIMVQSVMEFQLANYTSVVFATNMYSQIIFKRNILSQQIFNFSCQL